MTTEQNTEKEVDSILSSVFADSPEDLGNEADNEQEQIEQEAATDDGDDEGAEKKVAEDPQSELEALLATERKRREDTQKAFHETNKKHKELLKHLSEKGVIDAEDLAKFEVSIEENDPRREIAEQFNREYPVVKALLEEQGENPDEFVKAVDMASTVDPTLAAEIMEQPVAKRTAFILRKGRELLPVVQYVQENGGSVMSALKAAVEKRDTKAIEAAAYEKAKKELQEQYKDYVSPTARKPQLTGSSKPITNEDTIDGSELLKSVFG